HVRDLEHARFDRLEVIAEARHRHEDDGVDNADDLDLLLADADRLDDDDAVADRVEHVHDASGGAREAARVTAARHAADEEALVEESLAHADAVAQQRAA